MRRPRLLILTKYLIIGKVVLIKRDDDQGRPDYANHESHGHEQLTDQHILNNHINFEEYGKFVYMAKNEKRPWH